MIDTHSHLFDEAFDDVEGCIARCRENGVDKVILVGFSHETNVKAQEYSKKYDIFYPTAGLHPSEAGVGYLEDFDKLKEFVKNNKVYAIGECGLDYHWDTTYVKEQHELFRLQIELAIELDLPLIVHSRDAAQDTFDILKEYSGRLKAVLHCYSGSLEMAMEYVKLGYYISLGGPVTFKNAKEPKRVAKGISLDRLLIETDCPYLAPTPFRGKRNESSYVRYVLDEIASLRGMDRCEAEAITVENSKRLFNL